MTSSSNAFVAFLAALLVGSALCWPPSALGQDSLPAELYQLLEDAKWLKEQGKIEEAREKLAEYDRRVAAWRATQKELEELGGEEWISATVKWAIEVDVSQGLDTVEREFNEGSRARASFRLLALRDRIRSGTALGRARCLYGKLLIAESEEFRVLAGEIGGPCELGSRLWGVGE